MSCCSFVSRFSGPPTCERHHAARWPRPAPLHPPLAVAPPDDGWQSQSKKTEEKQRRPGYKRATGVQIWNPGGRSTGEAAQKQKHCSKYSDVLTGEWAQYLLQLLVVCAEEGAQGLLWKQRVPEEGASRQRTGETVCEHHWTDGKHGRYTHTTGLCHTTRVTGAKWLSTFLFYICCRLKAQLVMFWELYCKYFCAFSIF